MRLASAGLILLLSLAGMGSIAQAQPVAPRSPMSALDLDQALFAYADRYAAQIVSAINAIEAGNPTPAQRRLAHLVKLVTVSSMFDTVTNADPFRKLMDVLAMVTLQSYSWIDEDRAEKEFGPLGQPLMRAFRGLRADIWTLASRVLRPDQLQQVDAIILDWRRHNPNVEILSYIRFEQLSDAAGEDTLEEIRKGSGLFAEIAETRKAVEDARLLAERVFYQAKRMPYLINWQAEAFFDDLLAKPEMEVSMKTAESLARSAERVSAAVEKLPQEFAATRTAMFEILEDRSGKMSGLLADVRLTAAAGRELAGSTLKLSESGERITSNLRDVAAGFNETSRSVTALLSTQPMNQLKAFDIEPYLTMTLEVNQTVAGLNSALDRVAALIDREPGSSPFGNVQIAFSSELDRLFWRVLLLMIAFFALLLAYRWLSSKIGARA